MNALLIVLIEFVCSFLLEDDEQLLIDFDTISGTTQKIISDDVART